MDQQQIIALLKLRGKYNYLYELLTVVAECNDEKLPNTVELFAFGDLHHYEENRASYLDLDEELINKLRELTLVSVSNEYDNDSITFEKLHSQYGLDNVPPLIINLVDDKIIDAKIDAASNSLIFGSAITLRDSFNPKLHSLRVLNHPDIAPRSFEYASNAINSWYTDKLTPIKNDVDLSIKKNCKSKSRKRKTPGKS